MNQREQIVCEARTLIGVPFHHRGRNERGVDCVGLILAVGRRVQNTGLPFEFIEYPDQPRSAFCYRRIRDFTKRITDREAGPGDIVLMHFEGQSTHFGILADNGKIIHASTSTGDVSEQHVEQITHTGRLVGFFRMNGVAPWEGELWAKLAV